MELHWTDHLVFLIIGIIIPLKAVLGTQPKLAEMKFNTRMKIQLYWGNNAYLWILTAVIAAVWWGNGREWHEIGIDWPFLWPEGWPLFAMIIFVLLYLGDTIIEVIPFITEDEVDKEEIGSSIGFLPQTAYEYFHFIFLALTAGICEEFIFRGYFIRYFQTVFSHEYSSTLAILIAAAIFGFVHFYQGWRAVVKITAMAIMFGFIFVHTESLWLLVVIHALVDLLGGAIAWLLLGKDATR
jgi:membrane protease YdiL (CAAX protease family)